MRLIGLALAAVLSAGAAPAPQLPDPLAAGWHGAKVCQLLADRPEMRVLRCTFPPGTGHDRHFHSAHWGYILQGSTMRITSASGTVVRQLKAGDSWWSDGIDWHEGVNIGRTTGVYIIVEPRRLGTAPSAAPALSTPPLVIVAPAVGERKVVIVQQDQHHGTGQTVTVQRNGKTYVFTTDRELTPAEIDARIARIEAGLGRH